MHNDGMESENNKADKSEKTLQELLQKLDQPTLEEFHKNFPINGKVLSIHGVEITQSIQSYHASEHLSGAPDGLVHLGGNRGS